MGYAIMSRCGQWLLMGITGLLLWGCGPKTETGPAASTSAVFFPAAPAAPRLQYLTTLTGADSIVQKQRGSFADWVVGSENNAARPGSFTNPYGMDAESGKLYICDVAQNRVHVIDMNSKAYATLGDPSQIQNPVNVTIDDRTGLRYVCDTGTRRVFVFDRNDKLVQTITNDQPWSPIDIAIGQDRLYICDITGGKVWVFSPDGKMLTTISRKGSGPDELSMPSNLDIGPDGNVYVVDSLQQIVKVFDAKGQFVGTVGRPSSDIGGFARPKGIAIDDSGVIYVADSQWDVVQLFNTDGQLLMLFGEPGEQPYAMGLPAGLAIDRTSLPAFRKYIDADFQAEYLLFVVNQFGKNKVVVYAFGRKKSLPAGEYGPASQPD